MLQLEFQFRGWYNQQRQILEVCACTFGKQGILELLWSPRKHDIWISTQDPRKGTTFYALKKRVTCINYVITSTTTKMPIISNVMTNFLIKFCFLVSHYLKVGDIYYSFLLKLYSTLSITNIHRLVFGYHSPFIFCCKIITTYYL